MRLRDITAVELAKGLGENDGITVVDVRTAEEFSRGHIPGAINIDVYDPNFLEEFAKLQIKEDGVGSIVLYCQTGGRSSSAGEYLLENGFAEDKVLNLIGGYTIWLMTGNKVES